MFEYLFLIRKVHFEEATGAGVMCTCVYMRCAQVSESQREQGEKGLACLVCVPVGLCIAKYFLFLFSRALFGFKNLSQADCFENSRRLFS